MQQKKNTPPPDLCRQQSPPLPLPEGQTKVALIRIFYSLCADIDECARGSHTCDASANCTNNKGSYECTCQLGFTGDGFTCAGKTQTIHMCTSVHVSGGIYWRFSRAQLKYKMYQRILVYFALTAVLALIRIFYSLGADIDECAKGSHSCDASANCTNNKGSYECTCQLGFTGDGFTCAGKTQTIHMCVPAFTSQTFTCAGKI